MFSDFIILVAVETLIYLYLYRFIYEYGLEVVGNISYYKEDGKGSPYGKYKFTERFMGMLFSTFGFNYLIIDLFNLNIEDIYEPWFFATFITFSLISIFELYKASKNLFLVLPFIIIIFLSLIIFPFNYGLILAGKIVIISVVMDGLANFFGAKVLSKLPKKFEILKLPYPTKISKNKSFTAALLSIIITFYPISILLELDILFVVIVSFGAVFGDALFSVFKRIAGIADYFPTLGVIGGLLDRIDGWIGAKFFALIIIPLFGFVF